MSHSDNKIFLFNRLSAVSKKVIITGYAWIFCSGKTTIFEFANTRSAEIPRKILGEEKLEVFLVVDRYAGYNKINCAIQYCHSHLDRTVEDLDMEFSEEIEVQNFVSVLHPLLCSAIKLRNEKISNKLFYSKAENIKNKIIEIIESPSKHLGIKIFKLSLKKMNIVFIIGQKTEMFRQITINRSVKSDLLL